VIHFDSSFDSELTTWLNGVDEDRLRSLAKSLDFREHSYSDVIYLKVHVHVHAHAHVHANPHSIFGVVYKLSHAPLWFHCESLALTLTLTLIFFPNIDRSG